MGIGYATPFLRGGRQRSHSGKADPDISGTPFLGRNSPDNSTHKAPSPVAPWATGAPYRLFHGDLIPPPLPPMEQDGTRPARIQPKVVGLAWLRGIFSSTSN